MTAQSVTVRVPAKVNLQLSVGPRGTDGYHPLSTVFQAVSLFDDVTAVPTSPGSGVVVTVRGEDVARVPLGSDNLAARAAVALAEQLDVAPDVSLQISKGIPVAGGMAGGSADAAGALVACAELWGPVPREDLLTLAASLGSDVPFLLIGGTAIGTGRGDRLMPVLAVGHYRWVFATGFEGLSTPEVYRRYDELMEQDDVVPPAPAIEDAAIAALRCGDAVALGAALMNDLQRAAISLRPALQTLLDTGLAAGALGAIISGSGPTVAFLVADDDAGLTLAKGVSASGLCKALRAAHGPVVGARVLSD